MEKNNSKIWLCILSAIIPIIGWIMYFIKKDENPIVADTYGICGIVGFVLNLIILIV